MPRLPLTGMTRSNPQNGHHAGDIRAHGAPSLMMRAPGLPLRVTRFILNTGHYHYSGLVSVTAAVWNCARAGVTLRLLGSLNELYTMTPMRRKNA